MNIKYHFLDIPTDVANDQSAPFAVLPIPYERTVTFGTGTSRGPDAILRASHETEDFDSELQIPVNIAVQTLPPPELEGLEDEKALELIKNCALPVIENNRFLLSLGGEHTITTPLVDAARNVYTDLSVLHIDAHLDLRDSYDNTQWSHACVMKRMRDMNINTVHVGTRSCSAAEHAYAHEHGIPILWAKDILADSSCEWIEKVLENLSNNVYISIDVDAFDPSLIPGTGTPEPGGLLWQHVINLLKKVITEKNVVASDVVELSPVPGSQVSEFIAARLGLKMLVYKKVL